MRRAYFTLLAEADLDGIALYSYQQWGKSQATQYILELRKHCDFLASNPQIGRPCPHIAPALRRSEFASHVVLYREDSGGILVSRILHERMLPGLHAIGEE